MSTPDAVGSFPGRPPGVRALVQWGRSRRGKLMFGLARDTMVLLMMWLALTLVTFSVFPAIAKTLPGVKPFDSTNDGEVGLLGLFLTAVAVASVYVLFPAPFARRARRALSRSGVLFRRLVTEVLGLVVSGRRLAVAVGWGVVTAMALFGIDEILVRVPVLAESVPPTDARLEAVAGAPVWAGAAFVAIYPAAPEEMMFRAGLLITVAVVTAATTNRWIRGGVVGVVLIGTSWFFGLGHLDWSLLNAVSAGITGLALGILAIATRSLWPAIVAHGVLNAVILIVPSVT